jgi:excisionase family DNA binding protein
MPVPVCHTAQQAYDAGAADALTGPGALPDLAARVAGLLAPVLEQIAASTPRAAPLQTVAQAAVQLGLSESTVWALIRSGELASVELPSGRGGGKRGARRIRQAEVDAFIARHTVR